MLYTNSVPLVQIIDMEKEILKNLNFDMAHPKPTDFLQRFSKAAKVWEASAIAECVSTKERE